MEGIISTHPSIFFSISNDKQMKIIDFFNSPLFKRFNKRPTMDDFLALSRRFSRFGLTQDDVKDAIQSACDFFRIPFPRMVQDLTNHPNGQTMFVNWDRGSYYDDVLCYNMQQLIDMKVDSKEAFSLVMTHECAHRVLQNTHFCGLNNGAWEQELCCDYFMGVRSGLWNMDVSKITMGLIKTSGSTTHPEGTLRALFIRYGKYHVIEMQQQGIPLTIQNLITEFEKYRLQILPDIQKEQSKYFNV